MNCEQCGRALDTTAHGTPRYRCVIVLRAGRPPLSRKCCPACWAQAVAGVRLPAMMTGNLTPPEASPPTVADLPLFAEVAA